MCFKIRRICLWIGAIISFLNFNGDILYVLKAPFIDNWMKAMVFFLGLKLLIVMLMSCLQMGRKSTNNDPEAKSMMVKCLSSFTNFSEFFLMISVGFFRVLSPRDYKHRILCGYLVDLITSMFPMLIIILINNGDNAAETTWLSTLCAYLHKAAFVSFPFEYIVILWEFNYNHV